MATMGIIAAKLDPLVEQLTCQCGGALVSAGLFEAYETLCQRVGNRLVEVERGTPATIRLTSFAELTLREVIATAQSTGLDAATKEARIERTLTLGGF